MKIQKIILPIIGVLLIATIITGVKASSRGLELLSLEQKGANLRQENQELKDKIVSSSSLTKIEKDAEKLGMKKPEKFVYMTNSGIALR